MAKINVTGNACVITSSIKYADIVKAKKYRPDALVLKDEEGKKEIFRIDVGCKPQATEYGVVFDGRTHDEDGFATYTTLIDDICGKIEEGIADIYGAALIGLNKIEKAFPEHIAAIDAEREAILGQISVQ